MGEYANIKSKEFFQFLDWLKNHKEPPRDPWRMIRQLHQEGILIKVKKGVYKYDPYYINSVELFEFPQNIKEEIQTQIIEKLSVKNTLP